MRICLLLLILCVIRSTRSTIISSPGLKRKHIGENCEFQWTMTGDVTSYNVLNMSTGSPSTLSPTHANHSHDVSGGVHVIRLFVWSINLWDAGNYSLSVTAGTTTTTDAGALLFVYDNQGSSSISHNGTLPEKEGDGIALSCVVKTNSMPSNPSYRPRMYYFWIVSSKGPLRNISSGVPTLQNGEVLTRYYIKEDGRTLVIGFLQYSDQQIYTCWGQEEGSRYPSNRRTSLHLILNYRPMISSWIPVSRKFNADIGLTVSFSFQYDASPPVIALPTWTLTNSDGSPGIIPPEFHSLTLSNPFTVSFSLPSAAYYGQYLFHIVNSIGTTNGSFNVLPPGPPDAPSDLKARYKTFRLLSVEWRCMWFNGQQQTAILQLKDVGTNAIVETFRRTESEIDCYNLSRSHLFEKDLQSDRDYEVSVWSNNSLGSSDEIKLTVRTTERFQLLLSHKTISINGSEATVNFQTKHGSIAELRVTCCAEETGTCTSAAFEVNASSSEVIMSGLTPGMVYLFDFIAYGRAPEDLDNSYYLGMIKGVKVDKDGNPSDPQSRSIIVLGCLLAIALVALLGCLIAFVYVKLRGDRNEEEKSFDVLEKSSKLTEMTTTTTTTTKREEKSPKAKQQPEQQRATKDQQRAGNRPLPNPKATRKSQLQPPIMPSPDEENTQETYEAMDRNEEEAADGEMYTPLDQPPPSRKQKRNLYT